MAGNMLHEIVDELIEENFRHLRGIPIEICYRQKIPTSDIPSSRRRQNLMTIDYQSGIGIVLRATDIIKPANWEQKKGGLAHELVHTMEKDYLIWDDITARGAKLHSTPKSPAQRERKTDMIAVQLGYGIELAEFTLYFLKRNYDMDRECGLTAKEVLYKILFPHAKKIPECVPEDILFDEYQAYRIRRGLPPSPYNGYNKHSRHGNRHGKRYDKKYKPRTSSMWHDHNNFRQAGQRQECCVQGSC